MTTNTKRTLAIALCGALLLSYVGYQVLRLRSKTFETQTAEYDSVLETIRTEGFALRDELTIPLMSDGVLVYNYDDGDKVGITSVLAYEYDSEEAAQNKQRMDEMQIELENLLTIQDMQGSGNSNLELLSNQINEKANNLIDLADTGITEGLSEVKEDLTFLFNKKQVALKESESFEKRMIYLENQLAYLEESAGEPLRSIETPAEGYFSKLVDGYENLYTTEYLNDMTLEDFDYLNSMEAVRQGEYVGKIVKNQNWYFIVAIDNDDMELFYQNTYATLDFGFANGETMEAQIYKTIPFDEEDRSIIIFRCKEIDENLLGLRRQSVDISFKTYSGLKVSREALCYEQSIVGVYVLERDAIVRFKPISIIRNQGSYVLCEGIGEDSNCLKRFDEVILNGGDLQDGQKIN